MDLNTLFALQRGRIEQSTSLAEDITRRRFKQARRLEPEERIETRGLASTCDPTRIVNGYRMLKILYE